MKIASMNLSTTQDVRENTPASNREAATQPEPRASSSGMTVAGAPSWRRAALGFATSLFVITLIAFGASAL